MAKVPPYFLSFTWSPNTLCPQFSWMDPSLSVPSTEAFPGRVHAWEGLRDAWLRTDGEILVFPAGCQQSKGSPGTRTLDARSALPRKPVCQPLC